MTFIFSKNDQLNLKSLLALQNLMNRQKQGKRDKPNLYHGQKVLRRLNRAEVLVDHLLIKYQV